MDPLPCLTCPNQLLDDYLQSEMGQRFRNALEIDFALRAGFTITLEDVSCIEFGLLQLLEKERQRYEKQEMEKVTRKRNARV